MSNNLNDLDFSTRKYDGWQQAEKSITFNGAVSGAIGDIDKANNPFDIFTVTGDVKVKIVGICTTTLSGSSATVEVGVSGATAAIIAQTTVSGADTITKNEIWHDVDPDTEIELATVMTEKIIANGLDVIGVVASANIDNGVIRFNCLWRPLSVDGKIVAA